MISVDAKKKELVGPFANRGREYQVKGASCKTHPARRFFTAVGESWGRRRPFLA